MSVTYVLIDNEEDRVLEASQDALVIDIAEMAYSMEGYDVHKESWIIPEKEELH